MDKKFVRCKRILVADAEPGMVLAEVVKTAGGAVVLPADFALTREALDRVAQFGVDVIYVESVVEEKEHDALHGMKAVVVSDSLFFRHMFSKMLYRVGMFVCDESETAEEGIRRAVEYKPELMVVDIDLPAAAGYDLIKRIRKKFPDTKLFAISTFHDREHITQAIMAGACDYLAKPVRWEALRPRLLKMFEPDAPAPCADPVPGVEPVHGSQ